MRARAAATLLAPLMVVSLAAGACGSDSPAASPPSTTALNGTGISAEGISPERCQANKAAGKITYLSSFDFAASPSIVDVVMADKQGYFDKLCLDVELKSSFSTLNYPLVAADKAQFSSAGSYTEMLNYAKDGARFVAVANYGKTNIAALVVRDDGKINQLTDLKGKTIGVKGALPPPIVAMLNQAGLRQDVDYRVVQLEGFDPVAHFKLAIDALPVYKSNEPAQLERAGVPFKLFDPSAEGIPGTFGILYTNAKFLGEHPTAAQDFVRASLQGMADAIADPAAAVAACLELIKAGGNKNFLSQEGETFRWGVESKLVVDHKGSLPIGVIDPALLQAEVDAYTQAGVFETKPSIEGTYDVELAADAYGPDGKVIMPR